MRTSNWLLIGLLFLFGCGTQSTMPVPKASIQGQVFRTKLNDSLISPIVGAGVFTNPPTDTVKTDAQGRYVIDVSPGRYALTAFDSNGIGISSDTVTAIAGRGDTVNLFFMMAVACKQLQSEISDAMGCLRDTMFLQTSSTVVSGNGLSLTLLIDSTSYQPGQQVTVTISEKNTLATEDSIKAADMWPVQGLTLAPCVEDYPFGISILQGYYDTTNVASITPLDLYGPPPPCPVSGGGGITAYDFEPSSGTAIVSWNSQPFESLPMTAEVTSARYWVGATFTNFIPGIYTVVGGDEWGALVILHFVIS